MEPKLRIVEPWGSAVVEERTTLAEGGRKRPLDGVVVIMQG